MIKENLSENSSYVNRIEIIRKNANDLNAAAQNHTNRSWEMREQTMTTLITLLRSKLHTQKKKRTAE